MWETAQSTSERHGKFRCRMKDCMWEEECIRVEIMLLQFKKKCMLNHFFFHLLPKRLKAMNILLEDQVLGFITSHNCKVLLWSAQL